MKYIFSIFLFFIASWSSSKAQILPDFWKDQTVQDQKRAWEYYLGEDERNVYVGLMVPEGNDQDQIFLTGLTLWIGKKPASRQSLGIRYPLGLPVDQRPKTPFELIASLNEMALIQKQVLENLEVVEFINLDGKEDTISGKPDEGEGFKIAASIEEKFLVYEISIPKEIIPVGKKTTFTFESGTLGRPENLRGTDAAGISVNGPTTINDQARLQQFYFFSEFTTEAKIKFKTKSLSLPGNN